MHNLSSEISESDEEEEEEGDDEAWSNVKVPSLCLVCCATATVEDGVDDGAGGGGGEEGGIGISTIFSGTVISLRCCRNFRSLA